MKSSKTNKKMKRLYPIKNKLQKSFCYFICFVWVFFFISKSCRTKISPLEVSLNI